MIHRLQSLRLYIHYMQRDKKGKNILVLFVYLYTGICMGSACFRCFSGMLHASSAMIPIPYSVHQAAGNEKPARLENQGGGGKFAAAIILRLSFFLII